MSDKKQLTLESLSSYIDSMVYQADYQAVQDIWVSGRDHERMVELGMITKPEKDKIKSGIIYRSRLTHER